MFARERSRDKKGDKYAEPEEGQDDGIDSDDPFGLNAQAQKRKQLRQKIMSLAAREPAKAVDHKSSADNQDSDDDGDSSSEQNRPATTQKVNIIPSKQREMFLEDDKHAKEAPTDEQTKANNSQPTNNQEEEDDFDMFDEGVLKQLPQNPTDTEAYYKTVPGEMLNQKYKVIDQIGKGVFGSVVKAKDQGAGRQVAIKILRQNEMLMKSGQKEHALLSKLKGPHIVGCFEQFFHRGHLCLVFELMHSDLRSILKGNSTALNLDLLRNWALQMFLALHSLRKQRLIHADIKPDNILSSKDLKTIKVCDFGTAFSVEEGTVIEYLVARYYRAPEIILGCPLDLAVDTWSIGCTLYELFTGQFMFPGRNNNEVLKYIMQMKGRFSLKMLKKGVFTSKHFDYNYNFLEKVLDNNTQQYVTKSVIITKTSDRELMSLLKKKASLSIEHKKLSNFRDFLEQCTTLNPKHRLTPEKALQHPFLNYQMKLT